MSSLEEGFPDIDFNKISKEVVEERKREGEEAPGQKGFDEGIADMGDENTKRLDAREGK